MKEHSILSSGEEVMAILAGAVISLAVLVSCIVARAEAGVWIEPLGVEVLDTPSGAETNSTYYVHCDADFVVGIEITWPDGAVEFMSGEYCNSKLYVVGIVKSAAVAWVSAYPQSVYSLFVPVVYR